MLEIPIYQREINDPTMLMISGRIVLEMDGEVYLQNTMMSKVVLWLRWVKSLKINIHKKILLNIYNQKKKN